MGQHLNDGGVGRRRGLSHGDRDGAIVGDDAGDLDGVTARRFPPQERRQHHLAAEIHLRQVRHRFCALVHPSPKLRPLFCVGDDASLGVSDATLSAPPFGEDRQKFPVQVRLPPIPQRYPNRFAVPIVGHGKP